MDRRGESEFRQLGNKVERPDSPEVAALETFDNPSPGDLYLVRFSCPEFTSLCPVTDQPDFAHLVIDYVPREKLVEEQISQTLSRRIPQPRSIPRSMHDDDRQEVDRGNVSGVVANRRPLVSPWRHTNRRVLPDWHATRRNLGTRYRCSKLPRSRLRASSRFWGCRIWRKWTTIAILAAKMRRIRYSAALALAGIILATSSARSAEIKVLDTYKDWTAYVMGTGESTVCFISSVPKKAEVIILGAVISSLT